MFLDEREALSFFQHQTQRHRRDANPTTNPTTSTTANPTTSTGTDVVEECCVEGCAYEEMYEYCWWTERTLKYEKGVKYSVSTRSAAIASREFNRLFRLGLSTSNTLVMDINSASVVKIWVYGFSSLLGSTAVFRTVQATTTAAAAKCWISARAWYVWINYCAVLFKDTTWNKKAFIEWRSFGPF